MYGSVSTSTNCWLGVSLTKVKVQYPPPVLMESFKLPSSVGWTSNVLDSGTAVPSTESSPPVIAFAIPKYAPNPLIVRVFALAS